MKSSKITRTLLALAFSRMPRRPVVLSLRRQKNFSGDDHRERGNAKGWVIFVLLSVVGIAVLLVIAGPPLMALFTQLMERAKW
ncbi:MULTISPECIES: hypothetical protein [unclassified Arthrobacter]|uniref:hypothetical protein n=1 Tax=unclassified Arthrobacter TaxID=235627 RepID=UPI002DFEA922|nr:MULTISPECIES: hypothetical protein [unclassified Arthrobacter]MEC5191766.1 hypothetical protein [Arthrobacter sp. MP_M4]MEC5203456.1 hypothetical protein [Arthrobacter sp. MP_M7]